MNEEELIEYFKNNPSMGGELLGGNKFNPREMAFLTIGKKALDQNDYHLAIEYYSKAINEQQSNWHSFSKRATCYRMINEFDKAINDALKSKELDDNFMNNQILALCYLFKKEYQKAIGYFDITIDKIEELEMNDRTQIMQVDYGATKSRALNNQAVCYHNLKEFNQAIICTTKGIEANPHYSNNYFIRGIIYWEGGRNEQAKEDLNMALKYGDKRAIDILRRLG